MAYLIIDFVPLAFGRAFMKDVPVGFCDEYVRCSYDGGKSF
jgi:hypothetical protein